MYTCLRRRSIHTIISSHGRGVKHGVHSGRVGHVPCVLMINRGRSTRNAITIHGRNRKSRKAVGFRSFTGGVGRRIHDVVGGCWVYAQFWELNYWWSWGGEERRRF